MVRRRDFLRSAAAAPIALSLVPDSVRAAQAIFADDFEDDRPGSRPDGWSHFANEDQEVVDTTAASGSQSFRMAGSSGGCWEATSYHPCDVPNSGEVTLSGAVKPTTEGEIGCHSFRGKLHLATSASDVYPEHGHLLLKFLPDGGVVGAGGYDAGSYQVDAWNTYRVRYQRSGGTVTVSYRINGEDRGKTTYSARSWEDDLSHLHLRSGDVAVYWDDFSVTAGGGDAGSSRSLSYGETVEGRLTTDDPRDPAYGFHADEYAISATAGETGKLTASSDGYLYALVVGPGGSQQVKALGENGSIEQPFDKSGEYTLYLLTVDSLPVSYSLTLGRADSGGSGPRSLSYGETVDGRITVDDPREPVYGFHADEYAITASAAETGELSVSSDRSLYALVIGPGGSQQVKALGENGSAEVQFDESGEHALYLLTVESLPVSYSLTLGKAGSGGTASHFRLKTVDYSNDVRSSTRVRLLHIPDGIKDPSGSAITTIATADSGNDGYATFDGTSGRPIPAGELSKLRSEYGGTVVVAAWTQNEADPWFAALRQRAGDFFTSEWHGATIPLDHQLLFGPSNGPGESGTATVWRSVDPSNPRRQTLSLSVSYPQTTYDSTGAADGYAMKRIGEGMASFQVPEDVTVDYSRNSLDWTAGNSKRPGSLAMSDAYPLAPSASLGGASYQEYAGGSEIGREALSGVVGQLPVLGTLSGFVQTIGAMFNVDEGVRYTIGSGSTSNPNANDVVSSAWKSKDFNFVFHVPVEFPDDQEREFAARALWEGGSYFGGQVHLDTPFTVGPPR